MTIYHSLNKYMTATQEMCFKDIHKNLLYLHFLWFKGDIRGVGFNPKESFWLYKTLWPCITACNICNNQAIFVNFTVAAHILHFIFLLVHWQKLNKYKSKKCNTVYVNVWVAVLIVFPLVQTHSVSFKLPCPQLTGAWDWLYLTRGRIWFGRSCWRWGELKPVWP